MALDRAIVQNEKAGSRTVKVHFLALGMLCVAIGYVGVIVPGLPSTVFFIGALWAFKRSSPRFESWLLNHRIFGPTLRDWEERHAIAPRTKVIAIGTMLVFVTASMFMIHTLWVKALVLALAAFGAGYIATRNSA